MKKLNSTLLSALFIISLLTSCTEDEPAIDITDVKFTDGAFEVTEGLTYNLDDILEVIGTDADQAQITFNSTDPTIVSVDGTTLTAVKVGTTKVTATEAQSELTASVDVTVVAKVVAVTGVTLDKEEANLKVGETFQLTATIAPEGATETGLTWSVAFPQAGKANEESPMDIATVSETGLVTAVSAGDVVVTATTKDGEFAASTNIAVTNIAVTTIALDQSHVSVNIGETLQMSATITPENATNQNIIWSMGLVPVDPLDQARINISAPVATDYATIDENGLITGVSECTTCGLVVIATSEDGSFEATTSVKVLYVPVASITLSPDPFSLKVGETQQMTATILPENASNKNVSWIIDASSANCRTLAAVPTFAAVDENGLVTGINDPGCYEVSVAVTSVDGPSQSVSFDVIRLATSVTITDGGGTPIPGKSLSLPYYDPDYQLATAVLPTNTSDKSVTWTSDNENYVTVDATGMVSGVADGTARITVTMNDGSGVSDYVDVTFNDL